MTTPHRTLQMALDALDAITDDVDGTGLNTMPSFDKALDAIAALREALNAPEPEPVAWYYVEDPWGANEWHFMTDSPESQECDPRDWTPLYAAPPAAPAPAAPPAAPAPAAPVPGALVEAVAKAIYWEWRRDAGYVPWVDGGNSLKQDDARKIARAVVSSAAPVVPAVPLSCNKVPPGNGYCDHCARGEYEKCRYTTPAAPVPDGMVPEFTDTARNALLWVLWHHQGGSSPVGQPIRFALGIGQHDSLNERQIKQAKQWADATGSTTAEFHKLSAAPVVREPLTDAAIEKLRENTFSTNNPFCPVDSKSMRKAVRAAERAHAIGGGNG